MEASSTRSPVNSSGLNEKLVVRGPLLPTTRNLSCPPFCKHRLPTAQSVPFALLQELTSSYSRISPTPCTPSPGHRCISKYSCIYPAKQKATPSGFHPLVAQRNQRSCSKFHHIPHYVTGIAQSRDSQCGAGGGEKRGGEGRVFGGRQRRCMEIFGLWRLGNREWVGV